MRTVTVPFDPGGDGRRHENEGEIGAGIPYREQFLNLIKQFPQFLGRVLIG